MSFFCACFSLGVEDMDEYNDRFPYVYAIKQDLSYTKKDMSDFVGEEDVSSDASYSEDSSSSSSSSEYEDMSELHTVVSVDTYRAIAIEAGSDNEQYPSSTVGEITVYFYYEGVDADNDEEEVTLSYGIYVSSTLPTDSSLYAVSDITGSTESDLYENGEIVSPFSTDDMLISSSVTLTEGWSSIYNSFSSNPVINGGSYLVIVFYENNDYQVTVTETVTTNQQTGEDETTYSYTFTKYTTNDIAFSFDKTLLYVAA